MKKPFAVAACVIAALSMALVPAISAEATTTLGLGNSYIYKQNVLYQSANYRYHVSGKIWMTSMSGWNPTCSDPNDGTCFYLSLGQRNEAGTQITTAGAAFAATASAQYFTTTAGSQTIPGATYYAFNWKANPENCCLTATMPQTWTGTYHY